MKIISFILFLLFIGLVKSQANPDVCNPSRCDDYEELQDRYDDVDIVFYGRVTARESGMAVFTYTVDVLNQCKFNLDRNQPVTVFTQSPCNVNLVPENNYVFFVRQIQGEYWISSCWMDNNIAWNAMNGICEISDPGNGDDNGDNNGGGNNGDGKGSITVPVSISITMSQNFEGENESHIGGPRMKQVSGGETQKPHGKKLTGKKRKLSSDYGKYKKHGKPRARKYVKNVTTVSKQRNFGPSRKKTKHTNNAHRGGR